MKYQYVKTLNGTMEDEILAMSNLRNDFRKQTRFVAHVMTLSIRGFGIYLNKIVIMVKIMIYLNETL